MSDSRILRTLTELDTSRTQRRGFAFVRYSRPNRDGVWVENQLDISVVAGPPRLAVIGWGPGQIDGLRDRLSAAIGAALFVWPDASIAVNGCDYPWPGEPLFLPDVAAAVGVLVASGQVTPTGDRVFPGGQLHAGGTAALVRCYVCGQPAPHYAISMHGPTPTCGMVP